ncbi:hypothetical protein ACWDA7_46250 [Streptomyces sp. NPDC001156]
MRWSWVYLLTRRSLELAGLRLLGNAARDVELLRIPADRRLYLTATPYVWEAPRLTEAPTGDPQPKRTPATAPDWDDPALLATMDQPKIFGPRLHTYSG